MPVPDARVELQIAGAWTDVTGYVVQSTGIQLSRGRSDEGRTVDPGSGTLTLLSPDGLFSNRNPNSPHFGLLPRNTPIRVSTTAGETVLDIPDAVAARATTPDHASLDVTGDIDVRIDLSMALWAGSVSNPISLIGKYNNTAPQRSWRLVVLSSGKVAFSWFPDGTNLVEIISADPLRWGPGQRGAIRATLDVNNGIGGYTVTLFTAPTIVGPWTQFDQRITTSGITSIANTSSSLEIGDFSTLTWPRVARRIYAAEVRSGIGGTLVASPTFSAQSPGATSFSDAQGRPWTITTGAAITDRRIRVVHSVPTWPARWHVSGHDQRAQVQTAGILRRLGQGRKALASTLRRRIPAYSPVAYWPMEDGETSTSASSALPGRSRLTVEGFAFAQDDSLAGSQALPSVAAGGMMRGSIPPPSSPTLDWMVEMVYSVSAAPGADAEFLAFTTTGTVARWRILMRSGTATVQGYGGDGTLIVNQGITIGADLFNGWQRIQFRAQNSGIDTEWDITWYNIGGPAGAFTGTVVGAAPGIPVTINTRFGSIADLRVGHLAVFPQGTDAFSLLPFGQADTGYNGETAYARLTRLASEEAATVSLTAIDGDTTRSTEKMGPQLPGALLDLLQDAADVDGGILYEDSSKSALKYRTRTTMENQTPKLVLGYGLLAPPFEPTENDLNLRNLVEVNRDRGGYGQAVLDEGPLTADKIGVYDESVTLHLYQDEQAPLHAGWRLHLASWDEARYPTVRIMLHKAPQLIPQVTALEVGDRIQITTTPSWMPPGPVDLIVQRIDDDIRTLTWDVTLTCSPAGPWTVGVVDDPLLGRVDTDLCTLASGVTSSATSWSVSSTGVARWIDSATYASEFPFTWIVDGEVVTVTAITGTGSTQTATVTRSVNGIVKAHSAGADIRLAQPTYLAL